MNTNITMAAPIVMLLITTFDQIYLQCGYNNHDKVQGLNDKIYSI